MSQFDKLSELEVGVEIAWKENGYFSLEKFKKIAQILYELSFENELQTLPVMKECLLILRLANTDLPSIISHSTEPFMEYFQKDFIFNVAKYLIINRTFKNQVLLDFSNAMLIECTLFFLTSKVNLKLLEMMKYILDPQRSYFKINDQDLSNSMLPTLVNSVNLLQDDQFTGFIQALQVGDKVDCVKTDYDYKKSLWAKGIVTKIKNGMICVQFSDESEKWIDSKQMLEIQKRGSQLKEEDQNWRQSLKEGMEVDGLDTEHLWYNSMILQTSTIPSNNSQPEELKVLVGYRVYRDNGDKTDTLNAKTYFGWSQKYDEWLPANSPRIQPLGSMAKTTTARIYQMQTNEEIVDDSDDHLLSTFPDQSSITVISRSMVNQQKSLFLLYIGELFARKGGFTQLLKTLQDQSTPLDQMTMVMQILGAMSAMFYRPYAITFIQQVDKAIFDYIFNNNDNNIRQLNKDKLESLFTAFGEMLKRLHPVGIKNNLIEEYQFQISLLCFKSEILEKQLLGLKQISEIVKNARHQVQVNHNNKKLSTQKQQDWLAQHQIFDLLFHPGQHDLLIKKSTDLIKFMVQESILTEQHLDKIWNCTQKGSAELKLALFKLLTEMSVFLKTEHQFYFLNRIKSTPVLQLTLNEIELVHEMTPFYQQNHEYCQKAAEILFGIIQQNPKKDLLPHIISRLGDLLKNWDMKATRLEYLKKALENLEQNKQENVSLKLMLRILDIYPTMTSSLEDQSKVMVLQTLQSEHSLFSLVLKQFTQFKQYITQNVAAPISAQSIDAYLSDSESFINQVKLRFNLFEFIISYQPSFNQILGIEQLQQLWEVSYNQGLIQEEKQQLYTLFNKLMYNSNNTSQEQLVEFFEKYMCLQCDYDYQGFSILKQVFCLVNNQAGHLHKLNNNSAFQYKSKVLPSKMIQMNFIWELCLTTLDPEVNQEVTYFITQLYLNGIDGDMKQEYINEFLDLAFKQIKQKEPEQEQENDKIMIRNRNVVEMISQFLDESEINGIGSLKAHCSLNKGQLVQIIINNKANQGLDMPFKSKQKIYSNQTLYELKQMIAKSLQLTIDQLELMRQSDQKMLSDKYNGRTMGELKIKNQEILVANKRMTQEVERVDLTTGTGKNEMVPKLLDIVGIWFNMFSTNQRMSMDQCASFINSCTGDNCKGSESRLKVLYDEWDTDQDGLLSLADFICFYEKSAQEKPGVVWANLQAYHYRNDLKLPSEVLTESVSQQLLPRYIIAQDHKYTHLLFSLLDYKEINTIVWSLISRLPTSPSMLVNSPSEESHFDWNTLLQIDNKYKLMYNLYSIEYLNVSTNYNFIQSNNFHKLFNLLKLPELQDNQIYTLILDILTSCLLLVLDNKNEKVFSYSSQIQIDITLSTIDQLVVPPQIYQQMLLIEQEQQIAKQDKRDQNNGSDYNSSLDNSNNCIYPLPYEQSQGIYGPQDQQIQTYPPQDSQIQTYPPQDSQIQTYPPQDSQVQTYPPQEPQYQQQKQRQNSQDQQIQTVSIQEQENKKEEEEEQPLKAQRKQSSSIPFQRKELDPLIVDNIIRNLDLVEYQTLLLEKLEIIMKKSMESELEIEERTIIQIILTQLTGLSLYDPSLLEQQLTYRQQLIVALFTKENVRKYIQVYLYITQLQNYYHQEKKQDLPNIIQLLFDHFPKDSQHVNEYFDLLCKLIEHNAQDDQLPQQIEFIAQKLVNHYSVDKKNKQDKVLVGELRLLEKLLHQQKNKKQNTNQQLIQQIFSKCLFNLKEPVKCKSKESRESGYRLLQVLAQQQKENVNYLLTELDCLIENVPMIQGFNYRGGSSQSRSQHNYCGIRNLGCICYMNAMLQQFFMTKAFRYGLLMADDKKEANLVKVTNKDNTSREVDDNVLHQMQKMFSFLDVSDRIDYNPIDFCFSFKDFSGQPVNVSIQQDAQEFLNMIFDKLEKSLEKTAYKKILDGIYGGKTYTIIQCKSCAKKTLREEDFYNLSLPIKHKNNLVESMEKYIEGEEISDYNCEGCNKKSDIIKRSCLSQLPNFLICHLQRIVFDMDTMMNEKINSRLEFPQQMSLFPFTYQALEEPEKEHVPEDYMYKLKGVVVHIGQAEFGHYYSYIDTDEQWLEFNDTNIDNFDKSKIDAECFGGINQSQPKNDWNWMNKGFDNSKNAYILVYEKVIKKPLTLIATEDKDEMAQIEKILNIEVKDQKEFQIDLDKFNQHIPSRLHDEVYRDNQQFMLEEHLYSEKFFKFVDNVIRQYQIPPVSDEIKIRQYSETLLEEEEEKTFILIMKTLEKLIYKILARTHDNDLIVDYSQRLQQLLYFVPSYSFTLFERLANNPDTYELIFNCPDRVVRQHMSQILKHSINTAIAFYKIDLVNPTDHQDKQAVIVKFLDGFLDFMPVTLSKSWTKMGQYFDFWKDFSFSGEIQIGYLMNRKFIQRSLDFYLEKQSPLYNREEFSKRTAMGNRYALPAFQSLIKTIGNLVVRCCYPSECNLEVNPDTLLKNVQLYTLEPIDMKCLFSLEFYEKSLRENQDAQSLCQIIQHLAYENEKVCFIVSYVLLRGMQQANTEDSKQYLLCFQALLQISDSMIAKKCEWLLGFPQFKARDNYGCYNMINLDDVLYTYQSTLNLENTESLIDVMLFQRRRIEYQSILIMQALLKLALMNDNIYQYLLYLPPPTYLNHMFHDWMPDFLNNYILEQHKYFINDQTKIQVANDTLLSLKEYQKKIRKSLKKQLNQFENTNNNGEPSYPNYDAMREYYTGQKEPEVASCLIPAFIIGKCVLDKVVNEEHYESNTLNLHYNDITSYLVHSKPTLKSNLAFKDSIVKDHYIFNTSVKSSDVESLFIKPRHFTTNADNNIDTGYTNSNYSAAGGSSEKKNFEVDKNKKEFRKREQKVEIVQDKDQENTNKDEKIEEKSDDLYMDYVVTQFIKKYVFSNNSQQYVLIQLGIKPKAAQFYNTKQLQSKMTFLVGPNSKGVIFNLHKMFPTLPWDEIVTTFDYTIMGNEKPNIFKAYLRQMNYYYYYNDQGQDQMQGQDQFYETSDNNSSGKNEENFIYNNDAQDHSYAVENGSNNDSDELAMQYNV